MVTAVSLKQNAFWSQWRLSLFASVKLTIALLTLTATTVLIGAWCPQEAAQGRDKVVEQFGPQVAEQLIKYGVADIFHSPWFLGLIGLLTVNMVACSVQRVFPKVRSLRQPMPFLGSKEIKKMAVSSEFPLTLALKKDNSQAHNNYTGTVSGSVADHLPENRDDEQSDNLATALINLFGAKLRRCGYFVQIKNNRLTAHWGKIGRLAPTTTHIGLLSLLAGVTITSWTGFGGFQPVDLHQSLSFVQSEHSKLWIGKLPTWHVRVDATRREDYESGEPKQWYSTLSVVDAKGKILKTQEISVNNPLTYDGVDIYQSSWGLHQIVISFNQHKYKLDLQQMGPRVNAAFLPLDADTIMLFSVHGQDQPVRVFAKAPQFRTPRILTILAKGKPQTLGAVNVCYEDLIPTTGLQYKSDPGLPVTYFAFGMIILGVLLASIPYRQTWASIQTTDDGSYTLVAGGVAKKAKTAFEKGLRKLAGKFAAEIDHMNAEEIVAMSQQQLSHTNNTRTDITKTDNTKTGIARTDIANAGIAKAGNTKEEESCQIYR